MADSGSRSVVLASIRSAVTESDSYLLRSYAVVGAFVAVFTALLFVLALPGWILATEGSVIDHVGRAFGVLLGVVLVAAMVAPLFFPFRRRADGRPARDGLFGIAGYLFLGSLYLALVVSTPEGLQETPDGLFSPVVQALYGLPRLSGIVFPILALCVVLAVEYGLDRNGSTEQ